jgi:Tol biopolymer transport system component
MTDQTDVREFLHRMANEAGFAPVEPGPVVRQARRRLARTVGGTLLMAGALVAGALVAANELMTAARSQMPQPGIPADRPVEPRPGPVTSGALAYALNGDIYVADPDGSNAVKIADATADAECEGITEYSIPSWSPDGRYLAFQRDCTSLEQTAVVITDPHGNAVAEFPRDGWGFTWSPDSTRVAVWETDFETIAVYGVDGERQTSLPLPPITGGANDAAPGWMPDGSALLLYGYVVVPLDGSAEHELSLGGQATYSPDGTRVAVVKRNSTTVIDADGAPVSEVDARVFPEAWSSDGDRFAEGDGELRVVDAASGTVTVLTEARAALDAGDEILGVEGFSPQGDRILYATGDGVGGNTALWSIGVDGSDARLLVAGTTQGEWRSR